MGLTNSNENIKCSSQPTVRVITPDGSLREFTTCVSASDALVNTGERETHFLCNSDNLYFNSGITAVGPTELLQPGQLYFMLPISMLGNVLSGIDMAAMAVKASSALAQSNSNTRRCTCASTCTSASTSTSTSTSIRRVRVAPDSIQLNENAKFNQRINENTVMVSGTRPSVKAVKKVRMPGKKGPRALRKQLSMIMEVVE